MHDSQHLGNGMLNFIRIQHTEHGHSVSCIVDEPKQFVEDYKDTRLEAVGLRDSGAAGENFSLPRKIQNELT